MEDGHCLEILYLKLLVEPEMVRKYIDTSYLSTLFLLNENKNLNKLYTYVDKR